jgi:hypothetical protein
MMLAAAWWPLWLLPALVPVNVSPLTTGGVLQMALPPEPLQDVLPQAAVVVEAEVVEVVSSAAPVAQAPQAPGVTGGSHKVAAQVVKLRITRVLKGDVKGELLVDKPEGDYALKAGNKGPFVLAKGTAHLVILGRYGPDTWRVDALEAALRKP